MKKIIIRTPNFIGDTINTTPCLELIKQEYPEAEFTIVGPDFVRDLFKYEPRVTRFITFPLKQRKKLSTYWKIIRQLRKEGGELGVIFVNTFISALIFKLGNIKQNIGYQKEGRGFLLNFSPKINYHKHYINRYASLFNEYIGNKYRYLPELSLRHTGEKTFYFNNPRKTIVLYLGGENKACRRYPDAYAVKLLQVLNQQGYNLVLIGDENDNVKHTQYVHAANIDNLINLTARTSIEGFINTIANADLTITIDSSALHVAAAVKTPFIGLMGLSTSPTSTIIPKVSFGRILKVENDLIREEDYILNITPELISKTVKEIFRSQRKPQECRQNLINPVA